MATQARSNIAVSNDCTSGDFTPNVYVTIANSDRTSAVQMASLRVTLNRNSEPDYAEFVINRDEGFTPTAGQVVEIGLGDPDNLLFGGQIGSLRYVRERSGDSPRFAVTCSDWTKLFSRRLITADFSGQSATTIATTIVETYTSGFFTYAIESSLATVEEFVCINETAQSALTRLANLIKGGFYVDALKIVHLWGAAGPSSSYLPPPPATLTNSLHSLKSFTPEYDYSQVRTRVVMEGMSANLRTSAPAGATSLPVNFSYMFEPSSGAARVGSNAFTYNYRHGTAGVGTEWFFARLSADVSVGATSITCTSTTDLENFDLSRPQRWLFHESGNVFTGETASGTVFDTIPASGYGSIVAPMASGSYVYCSDVLWGIEVDGVSGLVSAVEQNEPVVVRAIEEDASAQTAIAAIEGGDGIHEYFMSDSSLWWPGCNERAVAELEAFDTTLLRAEWTTYDLQATPGAYQVINLSSPSVLSTTLTIDSVSIEFPVDNTGIATSPTSTCDSNRFPRRTCSGSNVKLSQIDDLLSDLERKRSRN
jgi:hypothetical protein